MKQAEGAGGFDLGRAVAEGWLRVRAEATALMEGRGGSVVPELKVVGAIYNPRRRELARLKLGGRARPVRKVKLATAVCPCGRP